MGEPIYTTFAKCNTNFTELYGLVGTGGSASNALTKANKMTNAQQNFQFRTNTVPNPIVNTNGFGDSGTNFFDVGWVDRAVNGFLHSNDFKAFGDQGNTIFVDSIKGNNTLGARERLDRPFLHPTNAISASQSGDTMRVRPGNYYFLPDTARLVNGISVWDWDENVNAFFGTGTINPHQWISDQAGAITNIHAGGARFVVSNDVAFAQQTRSNSLVSIHARSIRHAYPGTDAGLFYPQGGKFYLSFDEKISHPYYDLFVSDPNADPNATVFVQGPLAEFGDTGIENLGAFRDGNAVWNIATWRKTTNQLSGQGEAFLLLGGEQINFSTIDLATNAWIDALATNSILNGNLIRQDANSRVGILQSGSIGHFKNVTFQQATNVAGLDVGTGARFDNVRIYGGVYSLTSGTPVTVYANGLTVEKPIHPNVTVLGLVQTIDGTVLSGGQIAVAGITNTGLTASRFTLTDANKKMVSSTAAVDDTEFGYLDGVTSSIQNQLAVKQTGSTVLSNIVNSGAITNVYDTATGGVALTNGILNFRANIKRLAAGSGITLTDQGTNVLVSSSAGGGNVTGPGSSTDNAFARFDGTSGLLIQNSAATLDDVGKITADSITITNGGTVLGSGTAGRWIFFESNGTYSVTLRAPNQLPTNGSYIFYPDNRDGVLVSTNASGTNNSIGIRPTVGTGNAVLATGPTVDGNWIFNGGTTTFADGTDVALGSRFRSTLSVVGLLSADSLKVTNTSTLSGAVNVGSASTVAALLSVDSLKVTNTSTLSGAVNIGSASTVAALLSADSLKVTNTSTLSGAANIGSASTVAALLSVDSLKVTNTSTLSGAVNIAGAVTAASSVSMADARLTNQMIYTSALLVPQSNLTNFTADFAFTERHYLMTNKFHVSAIANASAGDSDPKYWTCKLENLSGSTQVASLASGIKRAGTNYVNIANGQAALIQLRSHGGNITNTVGSITLMDSP